MTSHWTSAKAWQGLPVPERSTARRLTFVPIVDSDCELNILTFEDEGGKAAFRHTASHIMAQAVKRLYPETKLAIGPSIKDGFYYDVD